MLLWVNYDAAGDDNPSLSFNVGDAGAGSNRANGPAEALKIDQWHHVVGVLDGATRKIYVDGEMKAEVTDGSTEPAILEGLSFRIGSWSNTANFDFDGVIDEVQLYDLSLTQEEITALHTWDGEEVGPPTTVDSSKLGDWTVKYAVTDSFGITTTAERQVRIFDPVAPVITLNGEAIVLHELATEYSDLGATVADADGNILDAELIKLTELWMAALPVLTHSLTILQTQLADLQRQSFVRFKYLTQLLPFSPFMVVVQFCIPLVNPILTLARWRSMQQMVRFP